jgi:predicted peptidase
MTGEHGPVNRVGRIQREGPLRYILTVPNVAPSAVHPVLFFLHGYDEGAPTSIEEALTRHGPLRPENAVRPMDSFVIVAPQLPTRGDLWNHHADSVRVILRRVHEEYSGDPRRSYLTGFSFGGNGVFDLALLQPDTWAALWAVDPTRIPLRDPNRPVWLSFGEIARSGKQRFIRALDLRPAVEGSHRDRVYLDEGADHVGSATSAYQDRRIYEWLLSKQLASGDDRRAASA